MDSVDLLNKYKELNESYKPILVYHVGIDAGFFSEFNDLIFMILYCLEHKIQFKLYSDDANFGIEKGWQDYFEPFCEEVHERFHRIYNRHPHYVSWRKIVNADSYKMSCSLLRWRLKSDLLIGVSKCIRFFQEGKSFDYYTHDLFEKISVKNKRYYVSELGIDGDYIQAYNVIYNIIYRFKKTVKEEICSLIEGFSLPEQYVGCQIRGGDKFIEYDLLSVDLYLRKIKEVTDLKNVFVLTDDYEIIKCLRKMAPEYNWFTFCQPDEKGYYNSAFSKTDPLIKRKRMIHFFASMELLERASLMLGTITSTPCLVLGIRKLGNVHWVDFEKNEFFPSIDYSIAKKKTLTEQFLRKK